MAFLSLRSDGLTIAVGVLKKDLEIASDICCRDVGGFPEWVWSWLAKKNGWLEAGLSGRGKARLGWERAVARRLPYRGQGTGMQAFQQWTGVERGVMRLQKDDQGPERVKLQVPPVVANCQE